MKVKYFISCIISLLSLNMSAQESTQVSPDIPPSPQAVAFNRLGDYQVNNNYGVPDISIPLFEIDFHGYKIPLALHYEATPIKPGYNYDVTGLGWTLSGNSCVSRTIKDRADERSPFGTPFELDEFTDRAGQHRRYMDWVGNLDKLNFQYDSYNIVLPSGRSIPFFMYKHDGTMTYKKLASDSNVVIKCDYRPESGSIEGFTVTDENGNRYYFTLADKSTNGFENDENAWSNVTWLLTHIYIPSKGWITYQYTDECNIHTQTVSEPSIRVSRMLSEMPEDIDEDRFRITNNPIPQCPKYKMRFISSISYGPTTIRFNYENDRRHMKDIVVLDGNERIRKIALNSYGTSSEWFLNSLDIMGNNDEDCLSYSFLYSNNAPGDVTDYWGNLCNSNSVNGLGNFNIFIDYGVGYENELELQLRRNGSPARVIPGNYNIYHKIKLQSSVDTEYRKPTSPNLHGVLQRITYPNGGCTTFNYENHRFPTATSANGDFIFDRRQQRIFEGGGFRIESIINYTADGKVASEDYYRYGFTLGDIIRRNFPLPLTDSISALAVAYNDTINHHIGCGEAVVDPNILTFMNYSYSSTTPKELRQMMVGIPSRQVYMETTHGNAIWWDAFFSANTFRGLLEGRRPVVYPEITVYHGHPFEHNKCLSKTVFKYDIYSTQLAPQNYYMSFFNQTNLPDTAYNEPLYYYNDGPGMRCMEKPAQRHQLKSKTDYSYNANNNSWEAVSEEKYEYNEQKIYESGDVFDSDVSTGHCGNHTLQMGIGRPLNSFTLKEFYKPKTQYTGRSELRKKTTTSLRKGGTRSRENTITEYFEYLCPGVIKKSISNSLYNTKGTQNSYIGTEQTEGDSVVAEMKARNMLASVTSSTSLTDPFDITPYAVSGNKIKYDFYGDKILPSKLYEYNRKDQYYREDEPIDSCDYEESIEVKSYDEYGNPTEIIDLNTGMHSVYLWGSYGRYMTAMIKDVTLDEVEAVSSRLTGDSRSRHATLQKAFPDSLIQTWDYKPLVGVTAHTDINGSTLTYEYDGLGRLKAEKRFVNGKTNPELIREYEYNYLNQ